METGKELLQRWKTNQAKRPSGQGCIDKCVLTWTPSQHYLIAGMESAGLSKRSLNLSGAFALAAKRQTPPEVLADLDLQDVKAAKLVANESTLHKLDSILSQLPSQDLKTLQSVVEQMRSLSSSPGDVALICTPEYRRIRHVFAMEVLMCYHQITRDSMLRMISQINDQLKYFERRTRNPVSDILSNVSTYVEEASFSLLQADVRSWFHAVMFARRSKLRIHMQKLRSIRKRLLREAAAVHCRLHEMEQLDTLSIEHTKQYLLYCDAIYLQLEGSDSILGGKAARKDILAPLSHLITESLTEFENRVSEYMDIWELHQPSHLIQHLPSYLAFATGVGLVSQSVWAMTIVAGSTELGKFAVWDCFLAPFLRSMFTTVQGFANVQPDDSSRSAAASLKRSRTTLSILLNNYEDKYSPETKAMMRKASKGHLVPINGLQSNVEYEGVIHGLLVQIQRLRVDLDSSMLQLVRLVEANRFAFSMMVLLPAAFAAVGGTYLMKVVFRNSSARAKAARNLTKRVQRVESLLIHAPSNSIDTADIEHADLLRLGEILYQADEMDRCRLTLGGNASDELKHPIDVIRKITIRIEAKLRALQQMHQTATVLRLRSTTI
eukprot:jgi/Bigna1/88345/estExt_fgenesh1_pg.C_310022